MLFRAPGALLAALATTLVLPADAYWRMDCPGVLVEGRLDPIVTPGKVSGHTHVILGGNGFAPTMDYASTQKSSCTSCTIKGDMSNYWIPKLYYHAQNGSFVDVPVSGGTVYYQQRAEYPGKKLMAYPEGFRMTAGNPERRDMGKNTNAEKAITHVCLNYNGPAPVPEGPPLPNKHCPNGVRSQVYFPSCWNGKDLDSPDHQSHMAYPSNYNSGKCPDSHPNPMISVFFEFIFGTDKFQDGWYGNKQPFVYAMGDDSGYGLHGDFLNGWDTKVLQRGIDMKTTNDAGCAGDVKCNGIFDFPDSYGESCTLPQLIDEPIKGTLDALPGCNPVTNNPAPNPDCKASKTLGVFTGSLFADVTGDGWAYLGCGVDSYYKRAMTKQLAATDDMTVEKCVKLAAAGGYAFAGLEYGRECWATNNLPDSATPPPNSVGSCNKACSGDSKHMCGDANRLSIYKKCSGGACENAKFTLPGDIGGGAAAPAAGTTPSGAGTSTGTTGAAGAPATSGSGLPSKVTTGNGGQTGAGGVTPPGSTAGTGPSSGGSTSSGPTSGETPSKPPTGAAGGNPVKPAPPAASLSAAATPNAPSPGPAGAPSAGSPKALPAGWKAAGCYVDPVRPVRALRGEDMAWWGQPITASNCAQHCDKKGFSMAGVEFGGQCFCGHKLEGGSAPADKAGACNMPCAGDKAETCGGPGFLNLSVKGADKRRRRSLRA